MLQKEVIDRMVAQPATSDYGRLSVMLQWRYAMEDVLFVPPEAFDPPPRVDSAVVRMLPRATPTRWMWWCSKNWSASLSASGAVAAPQPRALADAAALRRYALTCSAALRKCRWTNTWCLPPLAHCQRDIPARMKKPHPASGGGFRAGVMWR